MCVYNVERDLRKSIEKSKLQNQELTCCFKGCLYLLII